MSASIRQRRVCILAVSASLVAMVTGSCLVGCATDRLGSAPPAGVDLSGEWQLDTNLSDDPQRMPADGEQPARSRHRGGRGGRGGPGGGGGPGGAGGGRFPPLSLSGGAGLVRTLWQSSTSQQDGAASQGPAAAQRPRNNLLGSLLEAPVRMSIEQQSGRVVIRGRFAGGRMTSDELAPGGKAQVPFGRGSAERSAGWRDNIFVIAIRIKGGPTREEDYALDDEGHLILSTFISGSGARKSQIKRVYDRISVTAGDHR